MVHIWLLLYESSRMWLLCFVWNQSTTSDLQNWPHLLINHLFTASDGQAAKLLLGQAWHGSSAKQLSIVWLSTSFPWFSDAMKGKYLRPVFLQVCCHYLCYPAMKHKTPSPIRIQSQALLPPFNPFTSILNKTTPPPTTLDNPKSKFLQYSVYFCLIPGRSSSPPQSRHSLTLQDQQKMGQT